MQSGSGSVSRHRAGSKNGRGQGQQPTRGGVDEHPSHARTKASLSQLVSPHSHLEGLKDELQLSFGEIVELTDGRVGGSELVSFINGRQRLGNPREIGDLGKKLHLRINEWLGRDFVKELADDPKLGVELVRLGRHVAKLLAYSGELSVRSFPSRLEKVVREQSAADVA